MLFAEPHHAGHHLHPRTLAVFEGRVGSEATLEELADHPGEVLEKGLVIRVDLGDIAVAGHCVVAFCKPAVMQTAPRF